MNNSQMEHKFKFTKDVNFEEIMCKETYLEFKQTDYEKKIEGEFETLMSTRDKLRTECFPLVDVITSVIMYTPVNISRMIDAALCKFKINNLSIPNIHPLFIIDKVNELCDRKSLINDICDRMRYIENNKYKIDIQKGIYIYGPPGSGKTHLVKNILKILNYDMVYYSASDIRNKSVIDSITKYNMSNVNVLSMFQKKRKNID